MEKLVKRVLSTKKYRSVCKDTIIRLLKKQKGNDKSRIKAVKKKLHQIYAVYQGNTISSSIGTTGRTIRAYCKDMLLSHASTQERMSIVKSFYKEIFDITGIPKSIIDIACGVNPYAIPFMKLGDDCKYYAYDIDENNTKQLNNFFRKTGIKGKAKTKDVLCNIPQEKADIALLLKTIPCLEQQEKGSGKRLLEQLNTRFIITSFPTKSLSGRKNMSTHYEEFFETIAQKKWKITKLLFKNELVYIIEKNKE